MRPTNGFLSFGELRRWIAILDTARREYREDGNAARRFFDHELDDLLIDIGRFLPPNERRPRVLPSGNPDRATAEIPYLRGDGDCGGAPQPA